MIESSQFKQNEPDTRAHYYENYKFVQTFGAVFIANAF
jgi:hypothetical protein